MIDITVLYPADWVDYELLDSGEGEKLERFGTYIIARPDPRALWSKSTPPTLWESAHARFVRSQDIEGAWIVRERTPDPWTVRYKNFTFLLRPTEFKHVGIFPEQAVNWNWLGERINSQNLRILNLFAYTGGATLACVSAGAHVTHVDSVRSTIAWAKSNIELSGLSARPMRFIEDDAYKFVLREGRRGATYDGIIMDPPRFGRGTKGEVWKVERDLPVLLKACRAILVPKPSFLLINAYTADLSSLVLHQLLADGTGKFGGTISSGELALKASHGGRLLPNGIFARWSHK